MPNRAVRFQIVEGVNEHNRLRYRAVVLFPPNGVPRVVAVGGSVHPTMDRDISDSWAGMLLDVAKRVGVPFVEEAAVQADYLDPYWEG